MRECVGRFASFNNEAPRRHLQPSSDPVSPSPSLVAQYRPISFPARQPASSRPGVHISVFTPLGTTILPGKLYRNLLFPHITSSFSPFANHLDLCALNQLFPCVSRSLLRENQARVPSLHNPPNSVASSAPSSPWHVSVITGSCSLRHLSLTPTTMSSLKQILSNILGRKDDHQSLQSTDSTSTQVGQQTNVRPPPSPVPRPSSHSRSCEDRLTSLPFWGRIDNFSSSPDKGRPPSPEKKYKGSKHPAIGTLAGMGG